ncbi:DUF881 domain-containing protein [Nocardioides sp. WS12]|uniref:DUF881 domain-containing protein n=1 Tax=Nocardioides sp. WS12 TaxID=2486272 RepID=UPI0015F9E721|nr:DUF881 domain-containing protein [Nocardioides sp. WS12]
MSDTIDRTRTPLLTLITLEALDRDYQAAASRRGVDTREGAGSRVAVVLVMAAFAMLVTVAAVQTSQNADVDDASRASLISRIESRRAVVGDLQADIADQRAANTAAEATLRSLGSRYGDTQADATAIGALTGFEPVTGDGIRATLDNPPNAGEDDAVVRDTDLALLANGFWAAGAEAISINGQRLSPMSGIRNSGEPVEVNGIGIAPPYTILVVGNQRTLSANFIDTSSGLQFLALKDQYGFPYRADNEDDLHLPAAPASTRQLRSATVLSNPKIEGGEAP